MNKSEFNDFAMIWKASVEVTGGNPSDAAIGLAFTVLQKYPLDMVKSGLSAHLGDPKHGRFQPKPADVIYQIQKVQHNDGRPGPDEAWAIAMNSFNEHATVVLNDDIAGSLEYARDIWFSGDKIGARMAFKESYQKKIEKAREEQIPVKWWPSLGHDEQGRKAVLEDAVQKGLLPKSQVDNLLPAPITIDGQKAISKLTKMLADKSA